MPSVKDESNIAQDAQLSSFFLFLFSFASLSSGLYDDDDDHNDDDDDDDDDDDNDNDNGCDEKPRIIFNLVVLQPLPRAETKAP